MTHTMDYQGRDNFNTLLLLAFSLLEQKLYSDKNS
jgi:hypothetical protein